jgi:uncharacterized protein YkwD
MMRRAALILQLLVACAAAPVPSAPAPPDAEPEDAAAAEARVLGRVNALRGRHGLPALEASDSLREVARRHSTAMLSLGRLAHVLPASGNAADRLRQARIPFRRVLENVAKGGSALQAQQAVEDSPEHLRNLLDPNVGRAGVGLARRRLASGEAVVYLTQILVQPVDDGGESRLRPAERVREALWRERQRLGRPPLRVDPTLDAVAERAVRAMLRAGEPGGGAEAASRALALGRKLAAADVFLATSPSDAARAENVGDTRWRRLGVGVAVGDSPRYGVGLLWIVVLYTD